ncbi:MAG: hypothetical protein HY280_09230 [Nitrospinae bacterium]|nr:hypothetical protein [Nitrospinota bacterium]
MPTEVLAILVALASLSEGWHHHDDGLDHDDCATCAFVLHQGAGLSPSATGDIEIPVAFLTFIFFIAAVPALSSRLEKILGRAPPFSSR